jgi:hypothetical protein
LMLSLFVFSYATPEEPFFADFEDAFEKPEFHYFANYIEQHTEAPRPARCFA